MKVVHIAFECAPIYKTGGLGDVVGSLPKELVNLDIETSIILPRYGWIKHPDTLPGAKVPVYYVQSRWFKKPNIHHDPKIQASKYAHFALQALEELKRLGIKPDILHLHDWHTGLIPFLLKKRPDAFFENTKIILTIHNIAYQGKFPISYLDYPETQVFLNLVDEHQKRISYLKLGIESADFITTVSPHHAHEIRTGQAGFGLTKVIRQKRGKFLGIINGIDYKIWNPKIDNLIFSKYTSKTLQTGKAKNKTRLQKHLDLEVNPSIPLFGFIARLSGQKGIDLILPLLDEIASRRIQVVILGQGERKYIKALNKFQNQAFKDWISINFGFDEKLAHQIYAASDFFLIPSHYEPSGLTQMISMAYATIPIASEVGGLKDTIEDGKTGFLFKELSSKTLLATIEKASKAWDNKDLYNQLQKHALRKDFSWKRSARRYLGLYRKLLK